MNCERTIAGTRGPSTKDTRAGSFAGGVLHPGNGGVGECIQIYAC